MKFFRWHLSVYRDSPSHSPEQVLELSQKEIEGLRDELARLWEGLEAVSRQTEATRKKVYRDETADGPAKITDLTPELKIPLTEQPLRSVLNTGDPVN